jgi:carboxyl-terminal processing protease
MRAFLNFAGLLKRSSLTAGVLGAVLAFSTPASALNCQEVRHLVGLFLKMHFSNASFDDEMSRRTLDNFIKTWDPGKVYFLKADVQDLEKKYSTKLDDMITDANCSALDEVMKVYSKRFYERQKTIQTAIDAKHDFTVDEYMTIDRKKMEFATTTEEIAERWRQRVKFQLLQLKGTMKDLPKAREKLHKRYDLAAKRHKELTSDDMYSFFLNGFSLSLDPHSEYYSPEQLEDFRISTRLSLEGIGAVLRSDDGFTTIQSLVPGGAAFKTGKVKVDDKIIAVAQGNDSPVDVIDMDLREVVKLIRGTRGTEVRLTLVREDGDKTAQLIVPIVREQIQLQDRAAKSKVHNVQVVEGKDQTRNLKIGVIDLPSFYIDFEGRQNRESGYKSSSRDMLNEIKKLTKEGVDGIIVDLRSNGGGSLDESIDIAGHFFDKGPVVQIKDTRGKIYVQSDEDEKTYYSGPLVVMINRQSASASEIFAGAIQDYHRGLIVGDSHTFGKGTVQNLNDIDEKLGAIKVTISKFYRPSGSSTQLKGVESDVVLPSIMDEYEIGEKHYDYALPWEKIKASDYKSFASVTPEVVKQISQRSRDRVEKDDGFKTVFEAIKEYKSGTDSRSKVSLKEETADDAKGKKTAGKDAKDTKNSKDKKDKKKTAEEDMEEEEKLNIAEDYQLQEALRISGDYVQLMANRPMGIVNLPDLAKVSVANQGKVDTKVKSAP